MTDLEGALYSRLYVSCKFSIMTLAAFFFIVFIGFQIVFYLFETSITGEDFIHFGDPISALSLLVMYLRSVYFMPNYISFLKSRGKYHEEN